MGGPDAQGLNVKPSELTRTIGASDESEKLLPYPLSAMADPPISAVEARAPDTAICRWHNGLIANSPTTNDVEGRVYFCPMGRQYWRYGKQQGGMLPLPPLRYPKGASI